MNSITSIQLFQLLKENAGICLIDVREANEHAAFNIGGELIPLSQITKQASRIPKEIPVIIYCRKGVRSQIAIQRLQQKFSFDNLLNLTGGLDEWKKHIEV